MIGRASLPSGSAPRALAPAIPAWMAIAACLAALLLGLLGPSAEAAAPTLPPADASQKGGRSAMPNDAEVPLKLMPPGSSASPLPSEEIFPPQTLTIRFNHKKHVKEFDLSCKVCHAAAYAARPRPIASSRSPPRPATTATTSITPISRR